jgi:hypothetical protein
VRLLCADAPHPRPQESGGLRFVAPYEVEDVVRHRASVPPDNRVPQRAGMFP